MKTPSTITMPEIFPAEQDIPTKYQIHEFIEQREYLVNGELRQWEGPMNQVLSPVCIKTSEGFQQKSEVRWVVGWMVVEVWRILVENHKFLTFFQLFGKNKNI